MTECTAPVGIAAILGSMRKSLAGEALIRELHSTQLDRYALLERRILGRPAAGRDEHMISFEEAEAITTQVDMLNTALIRQGAPFENVLPEDEEPFNSLQTAHYHIYGLAEPKDVQELFITADVIDGIDISLEVEITTKQSGLVEADDIVVDLRIEFPAAKDQPSLFYPSGRRPLKELTPAEGELVTWFLNGALAEVYPVTTAVAR